MLCADSLRCPMSSSSPSSLTVSLVAVSVLHQQAPRQLSLSMLSNSNLILCLKKSLRFAPLFPLRHPPQSRLFLTHLVCCLGPLDALLPPQSMYRHQILLPRTLLPAHHFPALKSLMIPQHLKDNSAWHLESVTTDIF